MGAPMLTKVIAEAVVKVMNPHPRTALDKIKAKNWRTVRDELLAIVGEKHPAAK